MSKHNSLEELFSDIADAIREKNGKTDTFAANQIPSVIRNTLKKIPTPAYLTFRSPNSFTLKVYDSAKHWDGILEYSTDATTWYTWGGSTTLSSAIRGSDNVLYLRGTGNTVITGSGASARWVFTGSNITCIGNIDSLLDYITVECGAHPTMGPDCYAYMFYGCSELTQAPALPATTLADNCYQFMFYRCTGLTEAPALPATTLADSCYHNMFNDCTSLTQAPALPATTLANNCYYETFRNCTSLTQAPALPATTLASSCYRSMFQDCTGLTQAPALPATTLVDYCYQYMFQSCTSLTQAPALPATKLANNCYQYMFSGCTSLTQAPALPATKLVMYCYQNMFNSCTNLAQAPALPAKTLGSYCYQNMFYGCTSLTHVPALPATTLAYYCYRGMFNSCTKIKLSTTKTEEYTVAYRIPKTGTGRSASYALTDMFTSTGGTFTGTPTINKTYYLSNTNSVVG